jgi:hypothetical protein
MESGPRQRLLAGLRRENAGKPAFTSYECFLPRSAVERRLRNMGMCIVDRTVNVFVTHTPDVKVVTTKYLENGVELVRTDYETPFGNLYTLHQPAGFTFWRKKYIFSEPDDYKKLMFLIDNERYEPNYKSHIRAQELLGDDGLARGTIGSEPLQVLYRDLMGAERFGLEWMDHRDDCIKLYEACVRAVRRRYPVLGGAPAEVFNYGGNFTVEMMGPKVFKEYYMPHYAEAAELLHKTGKLIGSHFDGNCRLIAKLLAESALDYIEAFTPAPDTDMTLAEAVAAWPNKAIWINYPSSVHLRSLDQIAKTTRDLLDAAKGHPGFVVGITEDMPEGRWEQNLLTIMKTIDAYYE